jgi:hypothetical protein
MIVRCRTIGADYRHKSPNIRNANRKLRLAPDQSSENPNKESNGRIPFYLSLRSDVLYSSLRHIHYKDKGR